MGGVADWIVEEGACVRAFNGGSGLKVGTLARQVWRPQFQQSTNHIRCHRVGARFWALPHTLCCGNNDVPGVGSLETPLVGPPLLCSICVRYSDG
jgi:hypothetical protein